MNFRNPVCTAFHVNVVWYIAIGETGRNLSLRLKEHKTNCEKAELEKSAVAKHSWTNDNRIKWNEVPILATESHKFSRKMRESIEIEKHSTIDQEGKPLVRQYVARSLYYAKLNFSFFFAHACGLIRTISLR